jgi:hypothetical protein
MHEDLKIEEADYFLRRIAETSKRDQAATRHELSAFLSAARSALQYAYKEAKFRGSLLWYETAVSTADPVVEFLKDTRNINIHDQPFSMRTHTTIGVPPAVLAISGTRTMVITNGDSVMEWPEMPPQLPPRQRNMAEPPTTTYRYQFKEWPGPEDVLELCRRYLDEVKRIIADGRAQNILTP